ncbi:MAG: hypothetical protein IKU37_05575 [Candidatus Gastranaerophilales bacterium]|nr:hypothetical protein [Candidatus Gastranaerophilales bacterium]
MENLKVEFNQYLISQGIKPDLDNDEFSAKSIFEHKKEFEDFSSSKYGIDIDSSFLELSALTSLEFENGQFKMPKDASSDFELSDELMLNLLNMLLVDDTVFQNLDDNNDEKLDINEAEKFLMYIGNQETVNSERNIDNCVAESNKISFEQMRAAVAGFGEYTCKSAVNLETDFNEEQKNYEQLKANYIAICNGTSDELRDAQTNFDIYRKQCIEKFKDNEEAQYFVKLLDEYFPVFKDKNGQINAINEQIAFLSQEISIYEGIASDCQSRIENLEKMILKSEDDADTESELEKRISLLGISEPYKTEAVNEEKARIQAMIDDEKAKLEEAQNFILNAQTKKCQLELNRNDIQKELNKLKSKYNNIYMQINNLPEFVKNDDSYKAFMEAQKQLQLKVIELAAEEKENMNVSLASLNNIAQEYDVAKKRDYKVDCEKMPWRHIAKRAAMYVGYSEHNKTADIFLDDGEGKTKNTPWCGAFVRYILRETGVYDDTPAWYYNLENKKYCPDIYQAAKDAEAVIKPQEAQQGDLIMYMNGSSAYHVGLIESIKEENGKWIIITIEGNTGSGTVKRKEIEYTSNYALLDITQ